MCKDGSSTFNRSFILQEKLQGERIRKLSFIPDCVLQLIMLTTAAGCWCSRAFWLLCLPYIRKCPCQIYETACSDTVVRQSSSAIDWLSSIMSLSWIRWSHLYDTRALFRQIKEGYLPSHSRWTSSRPDGLRQCLCHCNQRHHLRR